MRLPRGTLRQEVPVQQRHGERQQVCVSAAATTGGGWCCQCSSDTESDNRWGDDVVSAAAIQRATTGVCQCSSDTESDNRWGKGVNIVFGKPNMYSCKCLVKVEIHYASHAQDPRFHASCKYLM